MEWEEEKLMRLQAAKARLIREYMDLQDRVDAMNSRVFDLCSEIESINGEICVVRKTAEENGHPLDKTTDGRELVIPPPRTPPRDANPS
jgi:TolA-binding protein